jgi:hypothetical protein
LLSRRKDSKIRGKKEERLEMASFRHTEGKDREGLALRVRDSDEVPPSTGKLEVGREKVHNKLQLESEKV